MTFALINFYQSSTNSDRTIGNGRELLLGSQSYSATLMTGDQFRKIRTNAGGKYACGTWNKIPATLCVTCITSMALLSL
ncbi:hypothetical protein Mapa_006798 [Marchantia paleacea]|nr:hypothetical protein Mapa_006798 [Marchantia paleacea]